MLSRPQVCWAAGMVKIPLITARRPAVLDGCPIAGSAARVAPEGGDLRGQVKDGPGGISRQQGGQSLSCEAPLPAGVTVRAPVSRAGVLGWSASGLEDGSGYSIGCRRTKSCYSAGSSRGAGGGRPVGRDRGAAGGLRPRSGPGQAGGRGGRRLPAGQAVTPRRVPARRRRTPRGPGNCLPL